MTQRRTGLHVNTWKPSPRAFANTVLFRCLGHSFCPSPNLFDYIICQNFCQFFYHRVEIRRSVWSEVWSWYQGSTESASSGDRGCKASEAEACHRPFHETRVPGRGFTGISLIFSYFFVVPFDCWENERRKRISFVLCYFSLLDWLEMRKEMRISRILCILRWLLLLLVFGLIIRHWK